MRGELGVGENFIKLESESFTYIYYVVVITIGNLGGTPIVPDGRSELQALLP